VFETISTGISNRSASAFNRAAKWAAYESRSPNGSGIAVYGFPRFRPSAPASTSPSPTISPSGFASFRGILRSGSLSSEVNTCRTSWPRSRNTAATKYPRMISLKLPRCATPEGETPPLITIGSSGSRASISSATTSAQKARNPLPSSPRRRRPPIRPCLAPVPRDVRGVVGAHASLDPVQ